MIVRTVALAVLCAAVSFAGVTWKGTMTSKNDGKETVTVMNGYAQKGNVREEFAEVRGAAAMEKGDYIIYRSDKNTMYIVDTKEKSYMEMPLDAMGQMMGGMMEMKVSNPKVSSKAEGGEKVSGYNCKKIVITSSYDMEMKVMFMTTKSHVEQTQEIWATKDVSVGEFGDAYRGKAAKTGMKDLDKLVAREMAALGNAFPVKTIMTQKSTSDGKTTVNTSVMTIESITTKALGNDLFTVPADYKKTSLADTKAPASTGTSTGAGTTKSKAKAGDDEDDAKKAEKAAKEMMKNLFK
ncbi:MAG: DUF4412 domain-containing protein [Spirochaetota bacterium]